MGKFKEMMIEQEDKLLRLKEVELRLETLRLLLLSDDPEHMKETYQTEQADLFRELYPLRAECGVLFE